LDQHTGRYDVAIIGSGIAGSILGAILARHGQRVILFEGGVHPRFAIGESLIIETSEILRGLATVFDVPEIAWYSSENYLCHIGTSHGVKRHFSFLYHREGRDQDPAEVLQAVIPREPYGHELHLFRQDSDYLLLTVALKYGATVLQNTRIADVDIDAGGVEVRTEKGETYQADYVVDAGGFRSVLAAKYDLRANDLQTHSRAIFTHMVDVPAYHQVGPSRGEFGIPFSLSEGTLHHVFEGGWLWVIPFDNHPRSTNPLCSVGLMLDPRVYPAQLELSPEEEFRSFLERFPAIRRQLEGGIPVRDWVRTGRLQYSSKRVVGDRFALLGHAAGFVDPLFSKGLYASLSCVCVLARHLIDAKGDGDYSAGRFQPVEDLTLRFIRANDALISHAFKTFAHYDLWSAYTVLWLTGAYLEGVKLAATRIQCRFAGDDWRQHFFESTRGLRLVGGAWEGFEELEAWVYSIVDRVDVDDPAAVAEAAAEIRRHYLEAEWIPFAFKAIARGANHLASRKFRFRLFRRRGGTLGHGAYRRHFFDGLGWLRLGWFLLVEKLRFAPWALARRRRAATRDRWSA
jgi:FADH2 O2-dependent halogenase